MTGTDHTGKAGSGGELHMQTQSWTTPKVQDEKHGSLSPSELKRHTPTLAAEVHSFPTPTAKDADGSRDTSGRLGSKRNKGRTLTDATSDLWPTPRTITGGGESAERKQELGREDAGGGDLQAAAESWPSPRAEDSESCGNHPGAQDSLSGATKTWPTPTTAPEADNRGSNAVNVPASLGAAADEWQTPGTDSFRSRGGERKEEQGLDQQARTWPTPNVPNGGRTMSEETVLAKGATAQGKRQVDLGAMAQHWPTPNASLMNDGESPENFQKRADRLEEKHGNTNGAGIPLPVAAASWPTPRADSKGGSRTPNGDPEKDGRILDQEALRYQLPLPGETSNAYWERMTKYEKEHGIDPTAGAPAWPTPTAMDSEDAGNRPGREGTGDGLVKATQDWPTPNSRDHKGSDLSSRNGGASLSHFAETGERTHGSLPSSPQVPVISVHGGELSPTDPSTASRRRLNPAFVCWLMGWPWWWTNPGEISSARQATELYLSRLRTLLRFLLGEPGSSR